MHSLIVITFLILILHACGDVTIFVYLVMDSRTPDPYHGAWLCVTSGDDFLNHHLKHCFGPAHFLLAVALMVLAVCKHAQEDEIVDVIHMHIDHELKKIITIKLSIHIKFRLYSYFFYDKIFKIKPHMPIFALYYFLTPNNWLRLLGTNILRTRTIIILGKQKY